MTRQRFLRALLLAPFALVPALGRAGPLDEVRATYERFLAAQNARDIAAVRAFLWDSPSFCWVSDGQTFWGRETMLARFARFQELEVWEARPDRARMVAVQVSADVAYLHFPLELALGAMPDPERIPFLVSALFRRIDAAWRIAALFTTIEKQV